MDNNCPHPFRTMELPNTKGVVFMTTFKDYTQEEKRCLANYLSAMYDIAEKQNTGKGLKRQAELLSLVTTALGVQVGEEREIKFTIGINTISDIILGADNCDFTLLWRNAADIMKICIEFALLGMSDKDIRNTESSDYRDVYLAIFKEISESDFEKLSSVVHREYYAVGADEILEKYRRICSLSELEDGYVNIYIPEINIPAFRIRAEIEDGCVDGEWDEVYEAIDSFKEVFGSDDNGSRNVDVVMNQLSNSIKKQIDEAEELQSAMLD